MRPGFDRNFKNCAQALAEEVARQKQQDKNLTLLTDRLISHEYMEQERELEKRRDESRRRVLGQKV